MTEQEQIRKEHADTLISLGYPTFPSVHSESTHTSSSAIADFEASNEEDIPVVVHGRIGAKRILGKVSFFHLEDNEGKIQIYAARDILGADYYNQCFKKLLDRGDYVQIVGTLFRTQKGEITVKAYEISLLAKSLSPLPEEKVVDTEEGVVVYNSVNDRETKYRQRYVDLAIHTETHERFKKRSLIIRTLRSVFDKNDFLEVETPILHDMKTGAAAQPFHTHHNALNDDKVLRIAPELYLKRCLVGGMPAVYEIGKNFRNEGISRFHNPEFTMLEAYKVCTNYVWLMTFLERLINTITYAVHNQYSFEWLGHTINIHKQFDKISFYQALENATKMSWKELSIDKLIEQAQSLGMDTTEISAESKLLDAVFSKYVEPTLIQPTFITDYPTILSPLAKQKINDPTLTERFELFIAGKEIANGFSELNDPFEQRERFEQQAKMSLLGDDDAMDRIDEDYITALMYGMPPASGIGIGVDRLVMMLTNTNSIKDVILFPTLKSR